MSDTQPVIWTPIGILRWLNIDKPICPPFAPEGRPAYTAHVEFSDYGSLGELDDAVMDCAAKGGLRGDWRHPIRLPSASRRVELRWRIGAKSRIYPNRVSYGPPGPIKSGSPGKLHVRPFVFRFGGESGYQYQGVALELVGVERTLGPWGSPWHRSKS